ncbi:MAG: hypothetical protein WA681_07330, partial [Candidatus Acidiferrales bacterium]
VKKSQRVGSFAFVGAACLPLARRLHAVACGGQAGFMPPVSPCVLNVYAKHNDGLLRIDSV